MSIPRTPLSFIYHVTLVAPYREEMHHDIRQAARRFDITEALAQQRQIPNPATWVADFMRASFEVERAAYHNRQALDPPIKVSMGLAATNLFRLCRPHWSWEVAHGTPGTLQSAPVLGSDTTLLECLYWLFYSPQFRSQNPTPPTNHLAVRPLAGLPIPAAWRHLRSALNTPGLNADAAISELTSAVALEYAALDWPRCW